MMKYITKHFQKGEISLTLSVLAIVVSVLGIALGSYSVQQNLTRSTEAQSGTFPYQSILELRDEGNNVVNFQTDMRWETTFMGETTNGNIKDDDSILARLSWFGPAPSNFENKAADIRVTLPDGYEFVRGFCDDEAGSSCTRATIDETTHTHKNVRIERNAKIRYGWIIKPVASSCGVADCVVRGVDVDMSETKVDRVRIDWDYPTNCPAYQRGTDEFWVDVIRQGSPDRIVCATSATDDDTTCHLGRPAPAGRELDTSSEEYRKEEWDLNQRYYVNVYLRDVSGSCVSQPGGDNFVWREPTDIPTLQPTQTPGGGGACSATTCQYSVVEETTGLTKCYQGNCLDGSENCSLNTNCGYVPGCSSGAWTTCPGHTPTPGVPNPTTAQGDTQCSNEGGTCVSSNIFCTSNGGNIDSVKGCRNTCCKFPNPTPTPAEQQSLMKTKRILVIKYNQKLVEHNEPILDYYHKLWGFSDSDAHIEKQVRDTVNAFNELIPAFNYRVVDTITRTAPLPIKTDLPQDQLEKIWDGCIRGLKSKQFPWEGEIPSFCDQLKSYEIDYQKIVDDHKICRRVNSGEIDEVWNIAMPGVDFGENDMFGPRPFGINGNTYTVEGCNKNVPTLAFNTLRDVTSIHTFVHRVEATMNFIYSDSNSPFSDFSSSLGSSPWYQTKDSPPVGCGNAHLTPHSSKDYQYDPQGSTRTYCEEFKNYPNINKDNLSEVSCESWGCNEYDFDRWFLANMPANEGRDEFGVQNNWWKYIHDPELALRESRQSALFFSDNNGDNTVDALDLSNLISNIGKQVDEKNSYIDVNGDGFVNTLDMEELYSEYGETITKSEKVHDTFWE